MAVMLMDEKKDDVAALIFQVDGFFNYSTTYINKFNYKFVVG